MTETNDVPTHIDASALTTASWIALTQIAYPISLGFSEREVAARPGGRGRWSRRVSTTFGMSCVVGPFSERPRSPVLLAGE